MEFSFDVVDVLPGKITIIETGNCESDIRIYELDTQTEGNEASNNFWIYHSSANAPWDVKLKKKKEEIAIIIDEMGLASAQAQNLRSPITTLKKLLNSNKQKIYFLRDVKFPKCVIGFLKIGVKRLFICDDAGAHHELDPLCVLDFYVHETKQRCGYGFELFSVMLQNEKIKPEKLAIDRPSMKFLSFLDKHYNLKNPIVQSNNFVIYPSFFQNREVTRPPIFLYSGKAMQPIKCSTSKRQYSNSGSYKNEAEALNSIKVSLCASELKKNKTFYSSAAKCLIWNDEESAAPNSRQKQHYTLTPSSVSKPTNASGMNNGGNWNVHTLAQSCSEAHKKVDSWSSRHSSPCTLTPVNSVVPNYSGRKWEQMQSSWNILGVKPIDYSIYQSQK